MRMQFLSLAAGKCRSNADHLLRQHVPLSFVCAVPECKINLSVLNSRQIAKLCYTYERAFQWTRL